MNYHIGQKIKKLRTDLGLSQSDLSGTHLSRGMISLIESGKTAPSVKTLEYISKKLGVSLSTLLDDRDDKNNAKDINLLSLSKTMLFSNKHEELENLLLNRLEEGIEDLNIKGKILKVLGIIAMERMEYEIGLTYFEETIAYQSLFETYEYIETYYYISYCYWKRGILSLSIKNAMYGSLLLEKLDYNKSYTQLHLKLLYVLASSYCKENKFKEGLTYIDEAFLIADKSKLQYMQETYLMLKGVAHLYLHEYENGIKATEEALNLYQKMGNIEKTLGCLTNLGILYRSLKQYEKSIRSLKECIGIALKNKNNFFEVNGLLELAATLEVSNEYDCAREMLLEGIQKVQDEHSVLLPQFYYLLGKVLIKINDIEGALKILNVCEKIEIVDQKLKAKLIGLKSEIFKSKGKTEDAYKMLENAFSLLC